MNDRPTKMISDSILVGCISHD